MAGSETTVHAALRAMVKRGHQVTVFCDKSERAPYEVDGISVITWPRNAGGHFFSSEYRNQWEWTHAVAKDADVLLTHLDCTSPAMSLMLDVQKPLVHFVHNHNQLNYHNVNPFKCQLAIFNSYWIAQRQQYKDQPWPGPAIIMHPVVEPEHYKCERGTKITLCNPTSGKGADTLYKLAELMPDYEFLTVAGIYGEQISPPNINPKPNVEHMETSPDMRDVLRKTKVILMPSNYESYGRVAVEAACAGIPSIVHPTEGLLESLGEAGIFLDRNDIPAWKAQIERLYSDEVYYRSRSDAALKLAASFDPESEFDRLEEALLLTSESWKKRNEVSNMKMWTPDSRIWETRSGKLVREVDGRIPQDAVRSLGLEPIPEEVAMENDLIPGKPDKKAVTGPAENKAVAPAQTKKRKAG